MVWNLSWYFQNNNNSWIFNEQFVCLFVCFYAHTLALYLPHAVHVVLAIVGGTIWNQSQIQVPFSSLLLFTMKDWRLSRSRNSRMQTVLSLSQSIRSTVRPLQVYIIILMAPRSICLPPSVTCGSVIELYACVFIPVGCWTHPELLLCSPPQLLPLSMSGCQRRRESATAPLPLSSAMCL